MTATQQPLFDLSAIQGQRRPLPPRFPSETRRLRLQLSRLCYNDCLQCGGDYAVEYIRDGCQRPFFGVIRQGRIIGVIEVTAPAHLPAICEWLTRWLAEHGWRVECGEFKPGGAKVVWPVSKTKLPRLVEFKQPKYTKKVRQGAKGVAA